MTLRYIKQIIPSLLHQTGKKNPLVHKGLKINITWLDVAILSAQRYAQPLSLPGSIFQILTWLI